MTASPDYAPTLYLSVSSHRVWSTSRVMHTISVQIVRFTDASQPGWVECVLRDAAGREWLLADKAPVFTGAALDEVSIYPQPGVVACEIVHEWTDEHGRRRCTISTVRPWDIKAVGGETQFEVFRDQIMTHATYPSRRSAD